MNKYLAVSLLLFSGCSYQQPIDVYEKQLVMMNVSEMTDELLAVQTAFDEIESQEDRLLIHKLFSGAGEYLVNCETMQMTAAFDSILGKVQTSYGWDREKYPDLTDAVSDYLISVDYQEPKELKSSKDRKDFAKIFQDLAEATKYE